MSNTKLLPFATISGARLLMALEDSFRRHVVLPEGVPLVLSLWAINTGLQCVLPQGVGLHWPPARHNHRHSEALIVQNPELLMSRGIVNFLTDAVGNTQVRDGQYYARLP
jgi:hypothetical protein